MQWLFSIFTALSLQHKAHNFIPKRYIEGESPSESQLEDFRLCDEHPLASVEILSRASPDVPQGYTHVRESPASW